MADIVITVPEPTLAGSDITFVVRLRPGVIPECDVTYNPPGATVNDYTRLVQGPELLLADRNALTQGLQAILNVAKTKMGF